MTAANKVLSEFGARATKKLSSVSVKGEPEEQLRGPVEFLITEIAGLCGLDKSQLNIVGETHMKNEKTRPDFAITYDNQLIGFVEVKAPGKGAHPRKFKVPHDKKQWEKLQLLPNLLITDGNELFLWQAAEEIAYVKFEGDVEEDGSKLTSPDTFLPIFNSFFWWEPIPPTKPSELAETCARMSRLLRDEVYEQVEAGNLGLTELAEDWRRLLFPRASDLEFADGYAQAVTFGLLVARTHDIDLGNGIDNAANTLRKTNSLIGSALRLLVDNPDVQNSLRTSLSCLENTIAFVNWSTISKGDPDAWLYFYEYFLEIYDNDLRKKTGSYYTPPQVVSAMVSMCEEVLKNPEYFQEIRGFASPRVTVTDPAAGTGTFILSILRAVAREVAEHDGPGAVPENVDAALKRLVGFEFQFGPFAVAQLRLIAEVLALKTTSKIASGSADLRLFVTDTLRNPYVEDEYLPSMLQPVAESRRAANKVKREEDIRVVIGNPPYREKARGYGYWIEGGSDGRAAPLDVWHPPASWGVSSHVKHLRNLYIYFWCWAAWKVFGTGFEESTGISPGQKKGIVSYISASGFLSGPGFERMRASLRSDCSAIWVIDCTPEGHQPPVSSRIFEAMQQPVCIVVAVRKAVSDQASPAAVRYRRLAEGHRIQKFDELRSISLWDQNWLECPEGWRDPFLPLSQTKWGTYPYIRSLFDYDGSGVMPGRTWVIAPDRWSLEERWKLLINEKDLTKKEKLFHPHLRNGEPGDKHIRKKVKKDIDNSHRELPPITEEQNKKPSTIAYGYRSFDRQYIIADARAINQPNPGLWSAHSSAQIYLTFLERSSPSNGPAVTFTDLVPDLDHYKGSFGGRVAPLWKDADATDSNICTEVLDALSMRLGTGVSGIDVFAYIAAVCSTKSYTHNFGEDLIVPGLRVPITSNPECFGEAVALGKRVIWLHTFGNRCVDKSLGRPAGNIRLNGTVPHIPEEGSLASEGDQLPEYYEYDPVNRRLYIGRGWVENVDVDVWEYEVSGRQIVPQWLNSRIRDRRRPTVGETRPPSPLISVIPEKWIPEYTTSLIDLLHVLRQVIWLEAEQEKMLSRVLESEKVSQDELRLPDSKTKGSGLGRRRKGTDPRQGGLI